MLYRLILAQYYLYKSLSKCETQALVFEVLGACGGRDEILLHAGVPRNCRISWGGNIECYFP